MLRVSYSQVLASASTLRNGFLFKDVVSYSVFFFFFHEFNRRLEFDGKIQLIMNVKLVAERMDTFIYFLS